MIVIRRIIIAIVLCFSCFINVYAMETALKIPNNTDPAIILNSNYEKKLNKTETSGVITDQNPMPDKNIDNPAVLYNTKILVSNIVYTGNTRIKTQILEEFSKDIEGKEVSFEDIKKITAKITKLYRDNGYLTSLAYVAPQNIKDGTLEINIIEGKIGDINIKGAKWTKNSYLKNNILKANNFREDEIFNINTLRKSLSDINNTAYLKGQVILQKGKEPQTTDIVLEVKDKFPVNLGISWDNSGREFIGVQRGSINLTDKNLTGFGDSIYLGTSLASGTTGLNTGYNIPLGPYGTELKLGYTFSKISLGGDYKKYNIDGSSHIFNSALIQPLYKGNNIKLTSDLSMDMIHSKTTLQNSTKLQSYDIRALRLGLTGIKDDNTGRWISRTEISSGLPIFGASLESSKGVGSSKFIKTNTNLVRVQAFPFKTTGVFKLSGQFSPDALLAPEQIQVGGTYSVRGYDEGLILGDIGYTGSIELRKTIPYLPDKKWLPLKNRVQFAAFCDFGGAKTIHQTSEVEVSKSLFSMGVGLHINLSKYIMANIDLGMPLSNKKALNQDSMKIHFGLSSNLI